MSNSLKDDDFPAEEANDPNPPEPLNALKAPALGGVTGLADNAETAGVAFAAAAAANADFPKAGWAPKADGAPNTGAAGFVGVEKALTEPPGPAPNADTTGRKALPALFFAAANGDELESALPNAPCPAAMKADGVVLRFANAPEPLAGVLDLKGDDDGDGDGELLGVARPRTASAAFFTSSDGESCVSWSALSARGFSSVGLPPGLESGVWARALEITRGGVAGVVPPPKTDIGCAFPNADEGGAFPKGETGFAGRLAPNPIPGATAGLISPDAAEDIGVEPSGEACVLPKALVELGVAPNGEELALPNALVDVDVAPNGEGLGSPKALVEGWATLNGDGDGSVAFASMLSFDVDIVTLGLSLSCPCAACPKLVEPDEANAANPLPPPNALVDVDIGFGVLKGEGVAAEPKPVCPKLGCPNADAGLPKPLTPNAGEAAFAASPNALGLGCTPLVAGDE